jgi:putative salt-induced outer membrane protein YdiY
VPAAPLRQEVSPPAAAEEAPPPKPKWTGSVTLGLSFSSGNSEITTGTFDAGAERKGEDDRFTVKAYYNYAEQEDAATGVSEITQRRGGGSLKYDYFVDPKTYVLGTTSAEYDRIADLELRTAFGIGVGFQRRDDEKFKHALEGGISYINEDHKVGEDDSFSALRLASNLGWQVREGVKLEQLTELFPSIEDADDFFGKGDTRLRFSLTEKMYAQIQWLINYDNSPSAGKHHTDNLIVLGLGWSF